MMRHLVLVAAAVAAYGQVASSDLHGEVRDESSAVVPAANVTARHDATGFARSALTGADGAYHFGRLMPGRYTITVRKPGFQTLRAASVLLEVDQKARLDLVLSVGADYTSIDVVAAVSPLQTGEPSVGYRLDSAAIRGLPLENRTVTSLATLGPGVIPRQLGGFVHDVVNDIQEGSRGAVALNPPINGARSTMNAFLLDGAADTDRNTFAIAVIPPLESVQEFRIQTSLPSAEFAQAGGGVVDVVTKAGSLDWHGNAFEYFRNEAADARNYFDDPGLPRPIFRQNQFGGSLGGRLPFPSTFFFAAYEGLRGNSAKSSLTIVPDAALRGGDFSKAGPIFDPAGAGRARSPFPGNAIPSARIDPIARKFLDVYEPLPNRTGGASNYLDATPNRSSSGNLSGRLDHQLRNQTRLFARYTLNSQRDRLAGNFPERPTAERTRAQQAAIGHTSAGAAWLNEGRFSFTRLRLFDVPESAFKTNVAAELGITGFPDDPFTYGLPYFLITNFSTVTDSPTLPQTQRDNLWHWSEAVSTTRGRQTWKLGFEWTHFQMNYLRSRLARGQYTFTGAFTANAGGAGGDPLADFLLGFPQRTTRNVGKAMAYLRQNVYASYAQHEWRANPRLTLSLGLRYEYAAPFREARGNLLNLDYSALPAPPKLARVDSATEPDRNNFAPRAGLVLRPLAGRNLVFRAGYGVYFSPEIAVETYDLVRNAILNENNTSDGAAPPLLTLRDGFPRTSTTGLPGYFGLDSRARTPYVQQWSASIQRQLGARATLEAAYIGAKGAKLGRFRQFNTPLHAETGENLPPRPGDLQQLRTFPDLGQIIQRQHISNSVYHALLIKGEKRMSRRLIFLASFVWSKSIDDADTVIPGLYDSIGAQDERNLRLERGLSFFNVGRRISAGFAGSVPGGRLFRPVTAHWQISGLLTLQDGTPVSPAYFALDLANSGTPNRPDIVPGVSIALPRSRRTADRFFNTDAFRAPRPYTFGNAGRNIIAGPGNNILDLALTRRFPVKESAGIEFRAEFFNAFNHPNWGIPGPYPDFGPFFGKIFSSGQPRRMQFALRMDF